MSENRLYTPADNSEVVGFATKDYSEVLRFLKVKAKNVIAEVEKLKAVKDSKFKRGNKMRFVRRLTEVMNYLEDIQKYSK